MKKILLTLCLSCILFSALTQHPLRLTSEYNFYQPNDNLIKQQVVFRDPGSKGRNLVWDFRTLKPVNTEYSLKYFIPDSLSPQLVCGMEHRTRYYYRQNQDSLWSTGYENNTTYMEYIKPELRLKFPFIYGDTLFSYFEGMGEYGGRLKLHVNGYTRVEADAEGELLLPGNETIKKALRVRTLRHYTETGKDSMEMILDTYSWYAAGMRYPVFESIKTSILKSISPQGTTEPDTVVFSTSFYYSPEEQRLHVGENEEQTNDTDLTEGVQAVFTEAQLSPNPVVTNLYIHYKLTRDARVWFSVHNNLGLTQCTTFPQQQEQGRHQTTIDMAHLIQGVYTVQAHVDDMVLIMNVVKK